MTKENIKLNVIASFDDDLNILNDLKATNEHELEILEKLNDICIGTLSDMIIRNFNKKQKEG